MGKKAESGNVLEIVIIAVLVLAVVGLVLWRFIDGNKTKTEDSSKQTSSQTTDTDTTPTGDANQADSNKGYVVIDDWGVRFKPEGSAQYRYSKIRDNNYGFSTSILEGLGKYCTASEGKVNLVRYTSPSAPQNELNYGLLLGDGEAIDGYYYFYVGPQSPGCSDDAPNSQDVNTEVEQVNQIKSLLFTIEAKQ